MEVIDPEGIQGRRSLHTSVKCNNTALYFEHKRNCGVKQSTNTFSMGLNITAQSQRAKVHSAKTLVSFTVETQ